MDRKRLAAGGIDYDSGAARCGSESLYESLLSQYGACVASPEAIRSLWEAADYEQLKMVVHNLKGTSGNLSIQTVFRLSARAMELLRAQNYTALSQVIPDLEQAQAAALSAIGG